MSEEECLKTKIDQIRKEAVTAGEGRPGSVDNAGREELSDDDIESASEGSSEEEFQARHRAAKAVRKEQRQTDRFEKAAQKKENGGMYEGDMVLHAMDWISTAIGREHASTEAIIEISRKSSWLKAPWEASSDEMVNIRKENPAWGKDTIQEGPRIPRRKSPALIYQGAAQRF